PRRRGGRRVSDSRPLRARWRSFALEPDGALTTAARLAACVYAEHSTDDRGNVRYPPSALTLADAMGGSESTARRARRELVAAGLLALDERPGRAPGARLTFPTPVKSTGATPVTTPVTTPVKSTPGTRGTKGTRTTTSGGARKRARADDDMRADGRAEHGDAQRLVAGYVNRLRELGATPTERVVGQVAREVAGLVRDGMTASTIAAALELLVDKRLNPSSLASLAQEVELGPTRSAADANADKWKGASVYDRP